MTESKIQFDAVESSARQSHSLIAIVLPVGFPSLMLFFLLRGFAKARSKTAKAMVISLGVFVLLLLVTGVGSVVSDSLSNNYRQHIENSDYAEVRGKITNLTESTILSGNPAASFEVAGPIFEYGRGSENYALDIIEKGGVLANGLSVRIWFKDEKILRI